METIIFERLHFLLAGASDHENAPLGAAGDTGAMFALFKRSSCWKAFFARTVMLSRTRCNFSLHIFDAGRYGSIFPAD
jgi:hypothetical protein